MSMTMTRTVVSAICDDGARRKFYPINEADADEGEYAAFLHLMDDPRSYKFSMMQDGPVRDFNMEPGYVEFPPNAHGKKIIVGWRNVVTEKFIRL